MMAAWMADQKIWPLDRMFSSRWFLLMWDLSATRFLISLLQKGQLKVRQSMWLLSMCSL